MTNDNDLEQVLASAGLPTRDEVAARDKRYRERRAAENRQTEKYYAHLRRNAPPPPPTEAERREWAVRGLERLAKQLRGTVAEKVRTLLDDARDSLQKHGVAMAELAELETPQHVLREHAQPVAARLMKHIGGFADENEAIGFVLRFWPITAGRVEASKMTDLQTKLGRTANDQLKAFWTTIEKAAIHATGRASNEAVAATVHAGRL